VALAAVMPPDTAGRMPAATENRRECANARMLVGEPEEMGDGISSTGSNEWCFFGKKGDGFRAALI